MAIGACGCYMVCFSADRQMSWVWWAASPARASIHACFGFSGCRASYLTCGTSSDQTSVLNAGLSCERQLGRRLAYLL